MLHEQGHLPDMNTMRKLLYASSPYFLLVLLLGCRLVFVRHQPATDIAMAANRTSQSFETTCGQANVVDVSELRIRAAPSLRAQTLGSQRKGQVVVLLCDAVMKADGINWRKVRVGSIEGWMSSRYLR